MIDVIKSIVYDRLKDYIDKDVRSVPAPTESAYPFVTYKLTMIDNTEQDRDDYMLEISCWDKDQISHARVIDLANKVQQALRNWKHIDENVVIMANRPNIGEIPDSDETIIRYDVTSILRTYRRD